MKPNKHLIPEFVPFLFCFEHCLVFVLDLLIQFRALPSERFQLLFQIGQGLLPLRLLRVFAAALTHTGTFNIVFKINLHYGKSAVMRFVSPHLALALSIFS